MKTMEILIRQSMLAFTIVLVMSFASCTSPDDVNGKNPGLANSPLANPSQTQPETPTGLGQGTGSSAGKEIGSKEIILEGLDTPWAIDFLPDGRMIFTERGGRISLYDRDEPKTTRELGRIDSTEVAESGLLGIAVDPQFAANRFIYAYYTYSIKGGIANRVSRFTLDETITDEKIILDGIPAARFHDGGRIKFGPDGMIYITTGDATTPSSAQDTDSIAGKILRINKDGTIPKDNPFANSIYSYGHRNPQGLAWNDKGELFASEHGPSQHDEINLIVKGGNYGWPDHCEEQDADTQIPIRCYPEFTLAPSGMAIVGNTMFLAGLRGTQLRKISFSNDFKTIISEEEAISDLGRIREAVYHQGYLYLATNNKDGRGIPGVGDDKIIKMKVNNNQ